MDNEEQTEEAPAEDKESAEEKPVGEAAEEAPAEDAEEATADTEAAD